MYHVLFVICIYIPISCIAFGIKYYYSIKHRILATFNINKKINSDNLYAFNFKHALLFKYDSSFTIHILSSLKPT